VQFSSNSECATDTHNAGAYSVQSLHAANIDLPSMIKLEQVVKTSKQHVGVGSRGLRPGMAECLFNSAFTDEEMQKFPQTHASLVPSSSQR
jgi:hypothetical protein